MRKSPESFSPVCHRALLFALVALTTTSGLAQSDKFNLPIDRAAPGQADQVAGARILADFRRAGIAGGYWLGFELRVMPRKGPERTVKGTMLGMRGQTGPLTRINIEGQNLLIQSGPQPEAWMAINSGESTPVTAAQTVAGTGVTVFDLQMPFRYWTDFIYEGEARVRGRPTHSFILRPPPDYVPPEPGLTGVRVLIDTQFEAAMVQAELLGAKGVAVKTIALLDLKKVGLQWIPKEIDFRNSQTRDKTRMTVTAAALNLPLTAEAFSPNNLLAPPPSVPSEQIVFF